MDKESTALANALLPLTLHQRINEVRKTNDYIKKDKRVEGMYLAVTHDQVTAELRSDLIKHGVLVFPSVMAGTAKSVDTGKKVGSKQTPLIRFEVEYAVHFVNVDDGKDRETIVIAVHAEDHGDKAPGKAASYAVKYALLKMFNIETGEDDEGRVQTNDSTGLTDEETKAWQKKCDAVKTAVEGETLWKTIVEKCREAKDEASMLTLRAYLSASMAKKNIKSGQKRNGATNERAVS